MTEIAIADGRLKVEVLGWDKLFAFKSRLDFPLENISGVRVVPDLPKKGFRGFRVPGTHLPGVIIAGSYYKDGRWTFWDVHNVSRVIEIALRNESYASLMIEVENPEASARLIQKALAAA